MSLVFSTKVLCSTSLAAAAPKRGHLELRQYCYPQHDPFFFLLLLLELRHYAAAFFGGGSTPRSSTPRSPAAIHGVRPPLYKVEYGDGSSTSGVLSRNTLTLTSSRALPGFVFGCSQQNLGKLGEVDGLIGLGRRKLSLPSQAAASFGATFSYCLPRPLTQRMATSASGPRQFRARSSTQP
jgi:hypothetical protein